MRVKLLKSCYSTHRLNEWKGNAQRLEQSNSTPSHNIKREGIETLHYGTYHISKTKPLESQVNAFNRKKQRMKHSWTAVITILDNVRNASPRKTNTLYSQILISSDQKWFFTFVQAMSKVQTYHNLAFLVFDECRRKNKPSTLGKTVIPVSARFKELAQNPPHKMFDTLIWFFDHSYGFLGTLSPCVMVHKVSTARYVRYLLET